MLLSFREHLYSLVFRQTLQHTEYFDEKQEE